jgi:DNA repair protein RadC
MATRATYIETLRVLHLDDTGTLVGITEHSDGMPGRVAVPLRRIVAEALACDATMLVLSHNHPGGDPQPSRADISATNDLIRAVSPLGIRVHDHVVTGSGRDFSFRAAGLL